MSNMADLTENYQLKWHSYSSHIHTCVASALNKEAFTDVCLCTMDGHRVLAHRFVLSACSQYFHDVLKIQHKITSSLPLLIVLPPEINYKTMTTLIQYMYSGETTVSKDILEHVLRGGDLLKVKGLWRPKEERLHYEKKLIRIQEHEAPRLISHTQPQKVVDNSKVQENVVEQNSGNFGNTQKDADKSHSSGASKSVTIIEEANNQDNRTTPENKNCNASSENKTEKTKLSKEQTAGKSIHLEEETTSMDNLQFLVIKEEPIEWSELEEGDMEMIDESDMFSSEIAIKPEVVLDDDQDDDDDKQEELYSPLTCELCSETFTLPGDWVRHIQTHTDMLPAKRQKRGKPAEEDNGSFPPLHCDMCQKYFPTPAEWVRHIQSSHTEFELRVSNKTTPVRQIRVRQMDSSHKICAVCNKKFPSHASMIIHRRTHTGEKPYMCEHCQKGFNVKSNLLRHLRTLHDRIINSTEVEYRESATDSN